MRAKVIIRWTLKIILDQINRTPARLFKTVMEDVENGTGKYKPREMPSDEGDLPTADN